MVRGEFTRVFGAETDNTSTEGVSVGAFRGKADTTALAGRGS
jgi:hypothetical protein